MNNTVRISALAVLLTALQITVPASAATEAPYDACKGPITFADSGATYEDFDFWLGDWQVVDTDTKELRSFDKVEIILDGCVIKQQWTQMDDLFASSSAPSRLRGTSLTSIDANGKWRQMWADSAGSNIVLTGGLNAEGAMVLTTEWGTVQDQQGNDVKVRNIWHWKPMPDGTIHNWGFIQRDSETGPKNKFYDITYHRSVKGGPAFVLKQPEK